MFSVNRTEKREQPPNWTTPRESLTPPPPQALLRFVVRRHQQKKKPTDMQKNIPSAYTPLCYMYTTNCFGTPVLGCLRRGVFPTHLALRSTWVTRARARTSAHLLFENIAFA